MDWTWTRLSVLFKGYKIITRLILEERFWFPSGIRVALPLDQELKLASSVAMRQDIFNNESRKAQRISDRRGNWSNSPRKLIREIAFEGSHIQAQDETWQKVATEYGRHLVQLFAKLCMGHTTWVCSLSDCLSRPSGVIRKSQSVRRAVKSRIFHL